MPAGTAYAAKHHDHPRVELYEAIQGLSDEQVLYTLDLFRSMKLDRETYLNMTPDPDEPALSPEEEEDLKIAYQEIREGKAIPFEIAMKELC